MPEALSPHPLSDAKRLPHMLRLISGAAVVAILGVAGTIIVLVGR